MSNEDFNLFSHFQRQFAKRANGELLCTEDDLSFSYADVEQSSARFAHALTALGALPGDRVSVQVEKSPESLCLYLACLRAGLVFHPLNMAYKRGELEYFLGATYPVSAMGYYRGGALFYAADKGVEFMVQLGRELEGVLVVVGDDVGVELEVEIVDVLVGRRVVERLGEDRQVEGRVGAGRRPAVR